MTYKSFFKPRLIGLILILFCVSLMGAYAYILAAQSEAILFFMMKPESWAEHQKVLCSKDRDRYVYGDLRPESRDQYQALENTCQQALTYPSSEHYVTNNRGQRIHYAYYALGSKGTHKTQSSSTIHPLLLFVHGISANYSIGLKYQPIAKRLGFDLALMDLSNHGKSDNDGRGAAYGCREGADLLAVLDELQKERPEQKILLFGTSMGAMTIANTAAELQHYSNIVGAVLENPQSSVREIVGIYAKKRHIPDIHTDIAVQVTAWRAGEDFNNCAPSQRVKDMSVPTFVMISEQDFMVPVWMSKKVYDQLPTGYPHQFKSYPYGDHAAIWNGQPDVFETDLQKFWLESLKFKQQSSL